MARLSGASEKRNGYMIIENKYSTGLKRGDRTCQAKGKRL
jgi:hypothetical protein